MGVLMELKSSKQDVMLINNECQGFQYFNENRVSKGTHSLALVGEEKRLQVVALKNVFEPKD